MNEVWRVERLAQGRYKVSTYPAQLPFEENKGVVEEVAQSK